MPKTQIIPGLLLVLLLLASTLATNLPVTAKDNDIEAPAVNGAAVSVVLEPTTAPTLTRLPITTTTPPGVRNTLTPIRTRTPTVQRTPPPTRVPSLTPIIQSKLEIRRVGNQPTIFVNGRATFVKGLNYNVNYTALDEDLRWQLHRRDFKIMRDAGVNLVIGWGIYDEITLQVALEFGIGVIMPFDLPPNGSYENEGYHDEVKYAFHEYVMQYKNYPAVWGWNPGGDELLYRMRTEENRTADKLQAAADLELELAQMAYALDPNHIVLVKEPRDWYLKYLYAAVLKSKDEPSFIDPAKFMVYGVNVYGKLDDIEMVLTNTRKSIDSGLHMAMIVSEFAPLFLPRDERPQNYAAIWDIAFRASGIGACAYVFGPDQPNPDAPNPYDPLVLLPSEYSMFDIDAKPIDNSLATLAGKWRALGTPTPVRSPSPTPRSR